jgi:hypothetical protein
MRLTIVNKTDSPILFHPTPATNDSSAAKPKLQIVILPSASTTTDLPKRCSNLTLTQRERLKHELTSELSESRLKEEGQKREFKVCLRSVGKARTCGVVAVGGGEDHLSPWRIYWMKVSHFYSLYTMTLISYDRYLGRTSNSLS